MKKKSWFWEHLDLQQKAKSIHLLNTSSYFDNVFYMQASD